MTLAQCKRTRLHEKERGLAAPFTCAYFAPQPQLPQLQHRHSTHLHSTHLQQVQFFGWVSVWLMSFSWVRRDAVE